VRLHKGDCGGLDVVRSALIERVVDTGSERLKDVKRALVRKSWMQTSKVDAG
jgi:hypothetical protein